MIGLIRAVLAVVGLTCSIVASAQESANGVDPGAPVRGAPLLSGDRPGPVRADNWIVAVANPLAAEAGARVLRNGGSAADAAVAVQLVLGLVEPQSSGLGGGAFLLYWDAENGRLTSLDGRETAPMAATPRLFQDAAGEPLGFFDAVVGGRSVGVPGTPMLLAEMHRRWGSLAWPTLFEDAIRLAEDGFVVSPRLASLIDGNRETLSRFDGTRGYFLDADGNPRTAGTELKNPDYAATLRLLSAKGVDAFYQGDVADDIVDTVRNVPGNPGMLGKSDLANYQVRERLPVCVRYRIHDICGMGPPSSGGLTVAQILKLLEPFDIAAMAPESVEVWRLIGDASRLAFADRDRYMADIDFVPMPVPGLLDPQYLASRSALLKGPARLDSVAPGQPKWDHAGRLADDEAIEFPSTSHFVIVDDAGNIVSMTTTIENAFGSRLMVRGFLLNNELTDFSFRSHLEGVPIANRVEPGKRPRSSMAPTIVLRDGAPVLALGSPGGSRIIPYVAKTLIAVLDWKMNVQDAVSLPHLVNRFGAYDLEAGTPAETLAPALEAIGYEVNIVPLTSGLHAVSISGTGLRGGADPRREGVAIGE